MINGIHTMFYTSEPEALRAFLRDKLGLRWADAGGGWLIMEAPTAEIGCHPPVAEKGCPPGTHQVSFFCGDVRTTVDELRRRGVEFTEEIREAEYGLITHFRMPGGVTAELYEPRYTLEFQEPR